METIKDEYCAKHKKTKHELDANDLKLIEAIFNLSFLGKAAMA